MKKVFFSSLGIILLILALNFTSHGQSANTEFAFTKNKSSAETSVSKAAPVLNRSNVNSKARKNFVMSYKSVSDEKWYNVTGGLVADFTSSDVSYQVCYDKKGSWVNTIRTYGESKLPDEIRHAVRSTYYDYSINLVQEIETPFSPSTYVIQLVGKTEIISLRMFEGEMSVLNTLTKSE